MKPADISGLNGIVHRQVATPVRGAEPVRPVRSETSEPRAAETSLAGTTGESAPVDAKRVDEIRRAVESGHYPLTPTRIADAMIAAGYLLRVK
jgi:negative regulator of flagellin synthesis FlgM